MQSAWRSTRVTVPRTAPSAVQRASHAAAVASEKRCIEVVSRRGHAQDGAAGPGERADGRPAWFGTWAPEHAACREGVVLIDMSFMSKFLVQGRDAGRVLDRLATAKVDGEPGTITYTQFLAEHGTLEADLTVTKLAPGALTSHQSPCYPGTGDRTPAPRAARRTGRDRRLRRFG